MPNHVTNHVTIRGNKEDIENFFSKIKGEVDGEMECLDFETLIPSPECVRLPTGISGTTVMATYKAKEIIEYGAKLDENLPDGIKEEVNRLCNSYRECGFYDWYDWNIKNWGTKWNAYSSSAKYENGLGILQFTTAWNRPYHIFCAMVDKFPNLNFQFDFASDDIGSQCGSYYVKEGKLQFISREGDTRWACHLCGINYEDYKDDEEADQLPLSWEQ